MIAFDTGRTEVRACSVCGTKMTHREVDAHGRLYWSAPRHNAPCGAPCLGGGVRPIPSGERPPGVSGIAHVHRHYQCGTPGCGGGVRR